MSKRESDYLVTRARAGVVAPAVIQLGKKSSFALADADVFLVYCASVFLAAVVGKWIGAFDAPVPIFVRLFDIADINAGEVLALCAMASVAFGARRTLTLTAMDYSVLGAATLFFLAPAPQNLPFVGATFAGGYFWFARRDLPPFVSLGQLCIAISAHAAWGPLLFRLLSAPILRLETLAIATLGQNVGMGLDVHGAELAGPNGWSVYILGPCSSFHNLSLGALVWLSLLKLGGDEVKGSAWFALFAGSALIVLLNASRILLMTPSAAQYQYWHDGLGRSVFICLTFAAIALPTLLSMRSMRRPRPFATPC